jgi:hypothetical protein
MNLSFNKRHGISHILKGSSAGNQPILFCQNNVMRNSNLDFGVYTYQAFEYKTNAQSCEVSV